MAFINPNLLPSVDSTFDVASLDVSWDELDGNLWSKGVDLTQWLQGTGSLTFTNDTAGACTIGPDRVAVTPGLPYVLWVPIRTSSTQTGLTTSLTLTWYNQATGGSPVGTPATFTTPLTGTTSGYVNDNAYNVFGVAPTGATHAQLSVKVSGLPARTKCWIDSVYFGEFDTPDGQLLSPEESSFENGPAGWTATGATLSRSSATAGNGNWSLSSVSTSASVSLESSTYNPVAPGDNLFGWVWLHTASADVTANVGIRWYTSSHTSLSDVTVSVPVKPASGFFQYVFPGTSPATAAFARVIVSYTNTVGETVHVDNVVLYKVPADTTNLLTYAQSTFEADMPAWTADNGTIERYELQIPSIPSAHAGKITPDGSGQIISASLTGRFPVTPGAAYNFRVDVGRHITDTGTANMLTRPKVTLYDASGNQLPVDEYQWLSIVSSDPLHYWSNTAEFQIPDTAVSASLAVEVDPTSSPLIDFFWVDNLILALHDLSATFDAKDDTGSVAISIQWPDDSEHPRNGTLRVRRVDQDGTVSYVRTVWGDSSALKYSDTGSPVVLEDYEAPLGTTIWYLAEWLDTSGNRKFLVETDYFPSPVIDSDYVWLKSPGQPAYQAKLVPEKSFSWTRAARNAEYDVVGRTNPIVWSDVRAGRKSSATFLALDTASHVQLDALLGLGTPVLIQAMPGLGADGNHYFVVGDVGPEPVNSNAALPGWRWTVDLTEINRPSGAIQGSANNTWQDLLDEGGFWIDELEDNLTWASLLTD